MKHTELKLIAKEMGMVIESKRDNHVYILGDSRICHVSDWNPVGNAKHTLMVLNWLKKQRVIDMSLGTAAGDIIIINDEETEIRTVASASHSDFQIAVCIAALEYIKLENEKLKL